MKANIQKALAYVENMSNIKLGLVFAVPVVGLAASGILLICRSILIARRRKLQHQAQNA